MTRPDWIAAAWDLTDPGDLHLWAMADDGSVRDRRAGTAAPDGTGGIAALAPDWLGAGGAGTRPVPVVGCGAPPGLIPPALRPLPCAPLGAPHPVSVTDARITLRLVPGLAQSRPLPDVVEGDETRLGGLLAARLDWDGAVCLTGPAVRWAELSAGEVVSLRTLSLPKGDEPFDPSGDEPAFSAALAEAQARPESLLWRLPSLRAEARLAAVPAATLRARQAGLRVGTVLSAGRPWWLGRAVTVIGAGVAADRLAAALTAQGAPTQRTDAVDVTLAGLMRARRA